MQENTKTPDDLITFPLEVVKISTLEDKSLIRAWREYLGLTQKELAARLGVSRATYARMEALDAKLSKPELDKLSIALDVQVEKLTLDD